MDVLIPLSVPSPPLLICTVSLAGFGPPAVAEKLRLAGDSWIVEGKGSVVSSPQAEQSTRSDPVSIW